MIGLNNLHVEGFVLIKDAITDEVIVDTHNAIHYENLSIALAKSLAQRQEGHLYVIAFGRGGSYTSGIGAITYKAPNVSGSTAEIHEETYTKPIIEDMMEIRHGPGDLFTDIVLRATLGFGEPSGQRAFDDAVSPDDRFVFDEIGLKSFEGLLLSHVIFHPVQKSLNRIIEVVYTLRLSIC